MKQRSEQKANAVLAPAKKQAMLDAIDEANRDLAAQGLIVDTGLRKWSERTGRYEIVWESKLYRRNDH
jgi:hypothetical protein